MAPRSFEAVPADSNFRLDRLASVHVANPLMRWLDGAARRRVPILMYHSISQEASGHQHPYYETNTAPGIFAEQMRFLSENGYVAADLEDVASGSLPGKDGGKHVVITFDDGYRDFYTEAYPILRRYGLKAVVFLVTGLVKEGRPARAEREFLTWNEARELHANGMGIGSHTVTHPELRFLDCRGIDDQLGDSKKSIEDRLGAPVSSFSYPFAFPEGDKKFVAFLRTTLLSHGYKTAVCTTIGRAQSCDQRIFLPRLPVNSWDDRRLFQAKLEGGYDWLGVPQRLYKMWRWQVIGMGAKAPDSMNSLASIGMLRGPCAEPPRAREGVEGAESWIRASK